MTVDVATGPASRLLEAHERLIAHYDIDRWHWKDDTGPLDICLGALLVQHTSWVNVETALGRLREVGAHSIEALLKLSEPEVGDLIRPAGTPVGKSRRLKVFAELVASHGGFEGLFDRPAVELRTLLLGTYGIGPETADVIVLYAAKHPGVVHDAYTARLCGRLGIGPGTNRYEDWRAWLEATLPYDLDYRRRNHAAIVVHCKELCRTKPLCNACPLRDICEYVSEVSDGAGNDGDPATLKQGDLRLLETAIAKTLLNSQLPARLAFIAKDGTPRVLPTWFHWTGEELVMPTFISAPHVQREASRVSALRERPDVAITIDTEGFPPHVLLVRGKATVEVVEGIVPEYAASARKYLGEAEGDGYIASVDQPGTRMARIAVRPAWVGVLDFETRLPGPMAG